MVSAGAWLACGMFKFHLVLPFMVLMLVQVKPRGGRQFLAGFVGVCLVLGAVSIAAVGAGQIIAYPSYVLGLEKTMAMGAIMPSDMPNLRGILYLVLAKVRYFDGLVILLSAVLYFRAARICGSSDPDRDDDRDLKFSLAVFATVLVSYHGLGYDLCVLAIPLLLVAGQLGKQIRLASWSGLAIGVGLAALLFSPLPLVLLMRYNRLALFGWALLLCFAGLAGELQSRSLRTQERNRAALTAL